MGGLIVIGLCVVLMLIGLGTVMCMASLAGLNWICDRRYGA